MIRYFLLFISLLLLSACQPTLPKDVAVAYKSLPEKIDFNSHIRPILSDRCWSCHGQDEATRQANLRLDQEASAFAPLTERSGYALVKGSLRSSQIYHRITTEDTELMMPPPDSNLKLSNKEKALITKWIEQGAEWKAHWSFIPPTTSTPPTIDNPKWTQYNAIDHFVQKKLIDYHLQPSEKADKERLLRRVSMDLTGLPPTLPEIEAFLKDEAPNAFEKVVDRLLNTTPYAERMAMEWMDIARYADSHGLHADGARIMWPWRDWVIKAFQENMPYDQFVTWQIAGDLLPNATKDQILATAFHRNHPMTAEGGAVDEEFRLEYVFDRSTTTATAFLGLTMECARCHDHKFDPFSQDEFYQLAAFFNNVKELGMTGDDGDYGPLLLLPNTATAQKLSEIDASIQAQESQQQLTEKELLQQETFIGQLINNTPKPKGLVGYFPFDNMGVFTNKGNKKNKYFDGNKKCTSRGAPVLVAGKKGQAVSFPAGYDEVYLSNMGLFEMTDPFTVGAWIYTTEDDREKTQVIVGNAGEKNNFWRGWDFYLDTLNQVSVRLIHSLPTSYMHTRSTATIPLNTWTHVAFAYDGSGKAAGVSIFINGKKAKTQIAFDNLYKNIHPVIVSKHTKNNTPLRVGKSYRSYTGESGFFKGRLDELKLYNRELSQLEINWMAEIEPIDNYETLFKEYKLAQKAPVKKIKKALQKLRTERLNLVDTVLEVMVLEEMPNPRPMHVLNRGVYDQPKHIVSPSTPKTVLNFPENLPKNRLGLAQWIFDKDNPLTARVAVNRYWQLIFGRGIVNTPHDFGSQGAYPSHPELLDYLAIQFRDSHWNIKALLKQMVLSYTYQQSSLSTTTLQETDPHNVWLARSSSYRLPAEMIRDNALAASGLLVKEVGGPSVKPYQPEGLWIDLGNFSDRLLHYKEDTGSKLYRRSLYTFLRRTSPPPFMTTFDVSSRDKCAMQREQTNTPLQALILLNDPQFVEASRVLAVRMQTEGGADLSAQLSFAFRSVTGRQASPAELQILADLFKKEQARFQNNPKEAKKLLSVGQYPLDKKYAQSTTAALAVVANTILNHDEAYMKR